MTYGYTYASVRQCAERTSSAAVCKEQRTRSPLCLPHRARVPQHSASRERLYDPAPRESARPPGSTGAALPLAQSPTHPGGASARPHGRPLTRSRRYRNAARPTTLSTVGVLLRLCVCLLLTSRTERSGAPPRLPRWRLRRAPRAVWSRPCTHHARCPRPRRRCAPPRGAMLHRHHRNAGRVAGPSVRSHTRALHWQYAQQSRRSRQPAAARRCHRPRCQQHSALRLQREPRQPGRQARPL